MSDDIVKKRLLRTDGYDLLREEPIYVNPDGPKAADEIERLRAELAAERERARRLEVDGLDKYERIHLLTAERDALRALLREALAHLKTGQWAVPTDITLMSRIDAALNKGVTNDD